MTPSQHIALAIALFTPVVEALAIDTFTNNICAIAAIESGDNMHARGINGELPRAALKLGEFKPFKQALKSADASLAKRYERRKKVLFTPADGSKPYYI